MDDDVKKKILAHNCKDMIGLQLKWHEQEKDMVKMKL